MNNKSLYDFLQRKFLLQNEITWEEISREFCYDIKDMSGQAYIGMMMLEGQRIVTSMDAGYSFTKGPTFEDYSDREVI